jgi:hypothetical protein
MKPDSLPKGFPDSPEAWEKLVSAAPGKDRPLTAMEKAALENGFVSHSYAELKTQLAAKRHNRSEEP